MTLSRIGPNLPLPDPFMAGFFFSCSSALSPGNRSGLSLWPGPLRGESHPTARYADLGRQPEFPPQCHGPAARVPFTSWQSNQR
jgi:hypothetical protein